MRTNFWAIGDLHLSFGKPRDFSIYGDLWVNHTERLAQNWRQQVGDDDVILLLGDLSWASTYARVKPDLAWIDRLPGRKVCIRGNHDRWWRNVQEVRKYMLPPNFTALQGDCVNIEGVLICGAQGHIAPQDPYYRPDPPANRYERELATLDAALTDAAAQRQAGQALIIMMHYPPFTSDGRATAFSEMIEQHAPAQCLYAHLHKAYEWQVAINQERNGIHYRLLAADFVNMTPQQVHPVPETIPSS